MNARIRKRLSQQGGDGGTSLIIVLIIVTVIAVVLGVVLDQVNTSIRTTLSARDQAGTTYDADGAAEAAINALRNSQFNNDTTSATWPKCFGNTASSDTLVLPNFYPATSGQDAQVAGSAAVKCTPDPDTGAGGNLVPITDSNKPGNAILTLGTNPSEDGVHVKPLGQNGVFRVHGTVVSDSNINVLNGSLDSNVGVYAHTGCTGTITSNPAAACSSGTAADPNYAFEPAFASPANAVPTYQQVPASPNCPGGGVMTFNPGYYDDAAALNNLTTTNACSVWWFKPGTYYFDFHNNNSDPSVNPVLSRSNGGAADQWLVSRGALIAGSPVDASGAVLSSPPNNPTIPGACQNPIKTVSAVGVQFIFGGDSQLVIGGAGGNFANAEICGTYSASRPPIAIYGLKSGADTPTTLNSANNSSLKLTSVGPTGSFAGANVASLANADHAGPGTFATWNNLNNGNQNTSITVSGFAPPSAVPAGSVVKSAILRVIHRDPASNRNPANTLTFTPTGSPTSVSQSLSVSSNAWTEDDFDVTATLGAIIHTRGFTGATAQLASSMRGTGTQDLDTIQLDLTYVAPAFRAEDTSAIPNNCVAATYTGGQSGQCAVLSTPTSYGGAFYVQGTTYLPIGVVDIALNNITQQVLRFGVIARSLWVNETGSLSYSGPVIEVPDNSVGFGPGGTIVYLTVYVCPAAATCSATGTPKLRAKVQIRDASLPPSSTGKRGITILSWSVLP